jgi:hypothetical protein
MMNHEGIRLLARIVHSLPKEWLRWRGHIRILLRPLRLLRPLIVAKEDV